MPLGYYGQFRIRRARTWYLTLDFSTGLLIPPHNGRNSSDSPICCRTGSGRSRRGTLSFRGVTPGREAAYNELGVDYVPPSRPWSLDEPGSPRCVVLLRRTDDLVTFHLPAR